MIHVVVGLPGAGKTTYVKGQGKYNLTYDLDYLAAALSLDHSDDNIIYDDCVDIYYKARSVANKLLEPTLRLFNELNSDTYIIRCAPSKEEMDLFDKFKDNIDFIFIDTDRDVCMNRRGMSEFDVNPWIARLFITMKEIGSRGYNLKSIKNTIEKW